MWQREGQDHIGPSSHNDRGWGFEKEKGCWAFEQEYIGTWEAKIMDFKSAKDSSGHPMPTVNSPGTSWASRSIKLEKQKVSKHRGSKLKMFVSMRCVLMISDDMEVWFSKNDNADMHKASVTRGNKKPTLHKSWRQQVLQTLWNWGW